MDSKYSDTLAIEYAIIGAMVKHKDIVGGEAMSIAPEDFYHEQTREMFRYLRDAPTDDPAMLITGMSSQHQGMAARCMEMCVTPAFFSAHAEHLREMANDRRVKAELCELISAPVAIQPAELIELAERLSGTAQVERDIYSEFAANMHKKHERIKTGYSQIDRMIGGLRVPSVSIIGARPSVGKTALALNIALKNESVMIFSVEMTRDMIIERLISCKADVPYNLFETQQVTQVPEQHAKAADCLDWLTTRNIAIRDDVYDVEAQSSLIARHSPKLVIVDYIQKVRTRERKESRRTEMEHISGLYKQIAKHCGCHIMILSQLTRAGKDEPTMSGLKESGGLEADGDYIFLLHRPYVLNKSSRKFDPSETTLLCDKNKFGRTGSIDMHFDGSRQRFTETEKRYEPLGGAIQMQSGFREIPENEHGELPF